MTDTPTYDEEPLFIGASNDGQSPSYFFKGGIDDMRIYDRAITAVEVELLCEFSGVNVFETSIASLQVFPNPTSESVQLALNESAMIDVYDLKGNFINRIIHRNGEISSIALPETQGVYLIRVTTASGKIENIRAIKL